MERKSSAKTVRNVFLIIFGVLFLVDLIPFLIGVFMSIKANSMLNSGVASDVAYSVSQADTSVPHKNTDYYDYGVQDYGTQDYGTQDNGLLNDLENFLQMYQWEEKLSKVDYYIDGYDVAIKVNENNVLEITETIKAYFNVSKHGIYRKIPVKNKVTRLDGTVSTNRAKVSGVDVNEEYSISTENGYKVIKIGDPDVTLTGPKTYTIKYKYDLGEDTGKGYDELYYNIIGDQWDAYIRNISFTIEMPKEYDVSKLGFSRGSYGSTNSSGITYECTGTNGTGLIVGKYEGVLEPSQGLTVRLELPEGYFVGAGVSNALKMGLLVAIPIIFLIISFILWWIFGKDERVVAPVEFYPPEGFNSAEVGFVYKGSADGNDIVSLLIYLANKGYLKIHEIEERALFSTQKTFKITKLASCYTGNNAIERKFFNGLFECGSTNPNTGMTEVTAEDLHNEFYRVTNEIKSMLNNKSNKNKFFESKSSAKRIFVGIMILLTYLIITVPPVYEYEPVMVIFALLFPAVGVMVVTFMLSQNANCATIIFALVWGLGFAGIPFCAMVIPSLLQDVSYLWSYISGIICIIGMYICYKFMPKRTPYGAKLYGRVLGFKNFLETAEKEKLEALVEQTPSYFYDILPYTYVLGISDKWIKQFESINLQSPDWYDGGSAFSTAAFGSFMASTMSSAGSAMTSSPSSSGGGGGSSGGGSSGGGSGGGGGGSW